MNRVIGLISTSVAVVVLAGPIPAAGAGTAPCPTCADSWALEEASPVYTLEASGSADDPEGATLVINAAGSATNQYGIGRIGVVAEPLRGHRVVLSADLRTEDAALGASLWMWVDGIENSTVIDPTENSVVGTSAWTHRVLTVPMPPEATYVKYGVMLHGGGRVTAQHLRLEAGIVLSSAGPPAPVAREEFDAAVGLIRENALRSASVDWTAALPEANVLTRGAAAPADVYPAIQYLLWRLGDHHSYFATPKAHAEFESGGSKNAIPTVRTLPSHVGYIKVPEYLGVDVGAASAYTRRVHQRLARVASNSQCGWIVDLRDNDGGNMWPMLAGLKPFLGDDKLGSFVGREGSGPPWVAGRWWKASEKLTFEVPRSLRTLKDAWVAVLIGPGTVSSGEIVALAFRGRDRARSFGGATGGLTTANNEFPLPDKAAMFLAVSVDADRTGRQYGDQIDPDESVASGKAADQDAALESAIAWLRASTHCTRRSQ